MYKSKRSQPSYNSKDNFMLYNFNGELFFLLKPFKTFSGLTVIVFYC